MDTSAKVRQFIRDNFYAASSTEFADESSLLDLGIVDSTGILEIVTFLEDTFGFTVEDDEMLPENLDSVANIVGFVTRKQG